MVYKVLLIDDHPIVRHGLAALISSEKDMEIFGQAQNAEEAISLLSKALPDIAIVDLSLEDMSGLDLLRYLNSQYPELPLLVLSMYDEKVYGYRAIKAGAKGYVMKQEATEHLIQAIRTVLQGEIYLSQSLAFELAKKKLGQGSGTVEEKLTNRELEVLQLLGHGLGTRQIAEKLCISIKTVETYRSHLKEKLGLETAHQLVQYAYEFVNKK
ncbi:MAG: DNA-binding response regulator [Planctomycetota bacterium]|nr:MAG: DNA-binding response regulator [Planctomycetota bacterium]